MKKNEATIFIFIASILFGILISSNINTKEQGESKLYLSPTEYLEAYNERQTLYKEIRTLRGEIASAEEKLEKYSEYTSNFDEVSEEMKNELLYNNFVLGNEDVEGPGIIITLQDGDISEDSIQDSAEVWSRLIHDSDVLNLVNDVKSAGAEVISINGQRIIDDSTIFCDGPLIRVNGIKVAVPFIIEAIGNQDVIYKNILENGSTISFLRLRGIKITVEKSNDLKIFSYSGNRHAEYMTISEGE